MRRTTGDAAGGMYKRWRGQQLRERPGPFPRPKGRSCVASPSSPPPSVSTHLLLSLCVCDWRSVFHHSTSSMTLRKASTLVYVAGFLVAAATLSTAHPTAAMPALSVTSSAAQPMAGAGSDAAANQGVALASILREDDPIYDAATLARAGSTCTRTAALCEKPSPSISKVIQIWDCVKCKNSCAFALDLVLLIDRPTPELWHERILWEKCFAILWELQKQTPRWCARRDADHMRRCSTEKPLDKGVLQKVPRCYCSLLNFSGVSPNGTQSGRNPIGQQHVSG